MYNRDFIERRNLDIEELRVEVTGNVVDVCWIGKEDARRYNSTSIFSLV